MEARRGQSFPRWQLARSRRRLAKILVCRESQMRFSSPIGTVQPTRLGLTLGLLELSSAYSGRRRYVERANV